MRSLIITFISLILTVGCSPRQEPIADSKTVSSRDIRGVWKKIDVFKGESYEIFYCFYEQGVGHLRSNTLSHGKYDFDYDNSFCYVVTAESELIMKSLYTHLYLPFKKEKAEDAISMITVRFRLAFENNRLIMTMLERKANAGDFQHDFSCVGEDGKAKVITLERVESFQ